jgi:hypothetical protein
VKEDEIAGHVAPIEAKKNVYRILVVKPEGKRTLGRPNLRWKNNINGSSQRCSIGWYGLNSSDSG